MNNGVDMNNSGSQMDFDVNESQSESTYIKKKILEK